MDDVRRRLFALIDATPNLDWLLVTKRPENVKRMLFECQHGGGPCSHPKCDYKPRPNLWLGASVENQAAADERIPHLLRTPAAVRFLSCEPLIGEVDLSRWLPIYRSRSASGESSGPWQRSSSWPTSGWPGWVIVGGESGFGAQPCNVAWVRSIVRQCKAAGVACFVKQLGAKPYSKPSLFTGPGDIYTLEHRDGGRVEHHLKDKKGGDIAEFPDDLKVREFPTPTGAAS